MNDKIRLDSHSYDHKPCGADRASIDPYGSTMRAIFVGLNVITIMCYGYDKKLAIASRQRVSEPALHFLEVAGELLGAFIGQIFSSTKHAPAGSVQCFSPLRLFRLCS